MQHDMLSIFAAQIYSVESHRLALALDRRGALVQIVRSAVLQVRCAVLCCAVLCCAVRGTGL